MPPLRRPSSRVSVLLKGLLVPPWSVIPTLRMPGASAAPPLAPLTPAQASLAASLRASVEHLAGHIGERNTRHPHKLRAAEDWLRTQLAVYGSVVEQPYLADGVTVRNLWVDIPGTGPLADEIVVVGAHYDSFPGSPAANDNATGVAAVLAIGEHLRTRSPNTGEPRRTVRLAAFTNEEPPYFWTELMGSLVMARSFRARRDRIVAMITPETIGCYFDAPGTQKYPPPLGLFYPSAGNFIAFLGLSGTRGSARLVKGCVAAFRHATGAHGVTSLGAAMPGWVPGVGSSDHWSFHRTGVPALMVTDTAPFRYPYYHTPDDTPDKIDYERAARVVDALASAIDVIARD